MVVGEATPHLDLSALLISVFGSGSLNEVDNRSDSGSKELA
jgi:hypothetical protein